MFLFFCSDIYDLFICTKSTLSFLTTLAKEADLVAYENINDAPFSTVISWTFLYCDIALIF